MTDRLTQLQDALDQLATQFYSTVRYLSTHHAPSTLPTEQTVPADPSDGNPDSPRTFLDAQHELARDLILKEKQIEYLIDKLPGIGSSEADQKKRLQDLQAELEAAEAERLKAVTEKEKILEKLDKAILGIKRY